MHIFRPKKTGMNSRNYENQQQQQGGHVPPVASNTVTIGTSANSQVDHLPDFQILDGKWRKNAENRLKIREKRRIFSQKLGKLRANLAKKYRKIDF